MSSERVPLAVETDIGESRNYNSIRNEDDSSSVSSSDSIVYPNVKIRYFLIFVPLASILAFTGLVTVLILTFRHAISTAPKQTLIVVWTLAPFVSAIVAWIANYAIKSHLSTFFYSFGRGNGILPTLLQVFIAELVRLATLIVNRPDQHLETDAYELYVSCWVALGWGTAEVVASIFQGYSHLVLYRDYAPDGQTEPSTPFEMRESMDSEEGLPEVDEERNYSQSPLALSEYIDDQLSDLLNMKRISELEEAYGMSITDVPIIISAIQRIDSLLASLGLTLLISSAFRHLPISYPPPTPPSPSPIIPPSRSLALPFLFVLLIHTFLSMLWTPRVLPVIGIHTASFVALMLSIGCVFAGLWRWGVLV